MDVATAVERLERAMGPSAWYWWRRILSGDERGRIVSRVVGVPVCDIVIEIRELPETVVDVFANHFGGPYPREYTPSEEADIAAATREIERRLTGMAKWNWGRFAPEIKDLYASLVCGAPPEVVAAELAYHASRWYRGHRGDPFAKTTENPGTAGYPDESPLVEAALGLRERLKADERRARNGRAASLAEAETHR